MQGSNFAPELSEATKQVTLPQLFEELHRLDVKRLMLLTTILKEEPDAFAALNMTREQAQALSELTIPEIATFSMTPISKPLFGLALNKEAFTNLKAALNDDLSLQCIYNYATCVQKG